MKEVMNIELLRKIAAGAVDLIFPRRCPVCFDIVEPRGALICPQCAGKLSPVKDPVCKKCGKAVEHERMEYCVDCSRRQRSFEYNLAVFQYNDCASRSMSAVKYKSKREFLDFYEEAAWQRFGKRLRHMNPQAVVPVPVHPGRRKTRGFNQAEILAGKLASRLQVPMCPRALRRVKNTAPQKELDPSQRLKNLEKAFAPGRLPGRVERVLLVDDIYTTGSTLETCARTLKAMGVKKVFTLTIFVGSAQ